MILIGIDPGVNTGYAEYLPAEKKLLAVGTVKIHEAMATIRRAHERGESMRVIFEDARLRKWFGSKGREALQGAGSVKRDCKIWDDFLRDLGVCFQMVSPQSGATKWDAARFAKLTGWEGRTSEHARDAAMLVFGRKA